MWVSANHEIVALSILNEAHLFQFEYRECRRDQLVAFIIQTLNEAKLLGTQVVETNVGFSFRSRSPGTRTSDLHAQA